jgi:ppGpp synthetase/RelA/SpoT-type nucleotidyltranferase
MPFITPQYSKKAVSRAGDTLISVDPVASEYDAALEVINNWRSSHSYPLQVIKNTLNNRAKHIDKNAIIAQRLKRLASIESKLRRLDQTRLAGMQDIGGCRAILNSIPHIHELVETYIEAGERNPFDRPTLIDSDNYIQEPKATGYRGIHLIMKYQSSAEQCRLYNGHKIEIQVRSKLQHAWATAVETASSFLGESLKSDEGDERWRRFFALAGSVFAQFEECPPIPDTPVEEADLIAEIEELWNSLQVEVLLSGFRVATDNAHRYRKSHSFLLRMDAKERMMRIVGYSRQELSRATDDYLAMEKEYSKQPEVQVVLVSVENIAKLKTAYPNYYADTGEFISLVKGYMPQV